MRALIILGICFCVVKSQWAQDAGVNLTFGLSTGKFTNELLTPPNLSNNGYSIGAEVRITEGPSYMVAAINYHQLELVASNEANYFDHSFSLVWFKAKTGVGFKLFKIGSALELHTRLLGTVNVLSGFPDVTNPLPFEAVNPWTFGADLGVTAFISFFTVGINYEKGFTELVNDTPEYSTKFDVLTLSAGVFF